MSWQGQSKALGEGFDLASLGFVLLVFSCVRRRREQLASGFGAIASYWNRSRLPMPHLPACAARL